MRIPYIRPQAAYVPCGIYTFRKRVTLEKAEPYTVRLFTSGRYILTVNGHYVCEGPCKGHEYVRYYDCVETDAFCAGENEICLTVMHLNDGQTFTTVYQSAKPEVIFEARAGDRTVVTDTDWECVKDGRYTLNGAFCGYLPPFEIVDFSNRAFESFSLETAGGFDFDKGVETTYGIARGQLLYPRPIPMLYPDEEIPLRVVKSGENFVELDAGQYTVAKVSFAFAANTEATVTYAECYETETGKGVRDDTSGTLSGWTDTVKTAEATVYTPFWARAFRFIRVEAADIQNALVSATAKFWHYPVVQEGQFACSDETFNAMYRISQNTMLCCMQETFVDCPYHEQQQYEMDSAIESAVLSCMTRDGRLVRKCIEEFAASQLPSGLLLANYPSIYRQVIPGFSLFWIFMLWDYLERTRDIAFVKPFVGTMDKILTYFDTACSDGGLIVKSRFWDFVDWVPGWEVGEPPVAEGKSLTVYNMYYARALLCAADICRKVERSGLAAEYRERYQTLVNTIKARCYDSEKGLYRDSTEGDAYSAHTIIWAILAEIETGERAQALADRIGEAGIRNASFSMNYYLFRALEKCGRTETIFQSLDGWKKMMDRHCTTWCENPDDPRSECHAWSSAPLYEFSSNLLGVKVGFADELVIQPTTAGLSYAKGAVPTRFGVVSVAWTQDGDGFKIQIDAPAAVAKTVMLPDGRTARYPAEVSHITL